MSHNRPNRGKDLLYLLGGLLSALGTALAVVFTLGRSLKRSERDAAPRPVTAEEAAPTLAPAAATRRAVAEPPAAPNTPSVPDAPALGLALHPGWHRVDEALPAPTYWPVVMAVGITLIAWGVVTTPLISGAGLVLFALALTGWIGDLRHERHEH